jgi:ribosome-binding protein aMBF1 (putative translation factor)
VAELLWDADQPLSAERVRDELERQGLLFGLITVQRALRELHRRHRAIEHSAHKPRGYYFPQRLPLFRQDDAKERAFAGRFASRLRAAREAAGLTAAQLAAASGVAETVIRDGESGAGLPSLMEADALAAALGVSLSGLVAGTDNQLDN